MKKEDEMKRHKQVVKYAIPNTNTSLANRRKSNKSNELPQ